MSNVVSLNRVSSVASVPALNAVLDLFANRRRNRRDAFWLKENAEVLQVLLATAGDREKLDLSAYDAFVATLLDEFAFFPQYYRFYLSMALDLSALGRSDVPVAAIAERVVQDGLIGTEWSDSHRAEARLLLARAGVHAAKDQGLEARLAAFAGQSAVFCLPNRQLAYALTHSVFHASDYGRRGMAPDAARRLSLIHAGIIAWLEDNLDLLAEVAVALHQSGETVPEVWRQDILAKTAGFVGDTGPQTGPFDDAYHEFLVLNWAAGALGGAAFAAAMPVGACLFHRPKRAETALRDLSLGLLDMGRSRSSDWAKMRWRLWPKLSAPVRARIEAVESLPEFEGFFGFFARSGQGSA
jgi:hypothetical protein